MGVILAFPPRGRVVPFPGKTCFDRDLVEYELANARFDQAVRVFESLPFDDSEARRAQAVRVYRAKLDQLRWTRRIHPNVDGDHLEATAAEVQRRLTLSLESDEWLDDYRRAHGLSLSAGNVTSPTNGSAA